VVSLADLGLDVACERLRAWPCASLADIAAALDYLGDVWVTSYGTASPALSGNERVLVQDEPGARYLCLATGGWSENEALISAVEANRLLYGLTWRLSACGGLHIFRYPRLKTP
jgi:hypothetical protein